MAIGSILCNIKIDAVNKLSICTDAQVWPACLTILDACAIFKSEIKM